MRDWGTRRLPEAKFARSTAVGRHKALLTGCGRKDLQDYGASYCWQSGVRGTGFRGSPYSKITSL
jgi:hypothetical protein